MANQSAYYLNYFIKKGLNRHDYYYLTAGAGSSL